MAMISLSISTPKNSDSLKIVLEDQEITERLMVNGTMTIKTKAAKEEEETSREDTTEWSRERGWRIKEGDKSQPFSFIPSTLKLRYEFFSFLLNIQKKNKKKQKK